RHMFKVFPNTLLSRNCVCQLRVRAGRKEAGRVSPVEGNRSFFVQGKAIYPVFKVKATTISEIRVGAQGHGSHVLGKRIRHDIVVFAHFGDKILWIHNEQQPCSSRRWIGQVGSRYESAVLANSVFDGERFHQPKPVLVISPKHTNRSTSGQLDGGSSGSITVRDRVEEIDTPVPVVVPGFRV